MEGSAMALAQDKFIKWWNVLAAKQFQGMKWLMKCRSSKATCIRRIHCLSCCSRSHCFTMHHKATSTELGAPIVLLNSLVRPSPMSWYCLDASDDVSRLVFCQVNEPRKKRRCSSKWHPYGKVIFPSKIVMAEGCQRLVMARRPWSPSAAGPQEVPHQRCRALAQPHVCCLLAPTGVGLVQDVVLCGWGGGERWGGGKL